VVLLVVGEAIEGAAVTAVVLLTGLLVHLSPTVEPSTPEPPAGGEATVGAVLGDGMLDVHLSPGIAGENTIVLTLTDADGLPIEPLAAPTVSAALPADGFGPIDAAVHDLGPGQYHCIVDLPLPGVWEITVQVRTSEFDAATATVTTEVGPVAAD
jgi:copper transport protein